MICLLLEISLFAYMWQFHFQFQLVDPLQKIWYRGFLLENGIYSAILIFFSVTYGGMRLGYMKSSFSTDGVFLRFLFACNPEETRRS